MCRGRRAFTPVLGKPGWPHSPLPPGQVRAGGRAARRAGGAGEPRSLLRGAAAGRAGARLPGPAGLSWARFAARREARGRCSPVPTDAGSPARRSFCATLSSLRRPRCRLSPPRPAPAPSLSLDPWQRQPAHGCVQGARRAVALHCLWLPPQSAELCLESQSRFVIAL